MRSMLSVTDAAISLSKNRINPTYPPGESKSAFQLSKFDQISRATYAVLCLARSI